MTDEDLVKAVWNRRVGAWAGGGPLEIAYSDLAAAGLALAGTDAQRLLWLRLEAENGEDED